MNLALLDVRYHLGRFILTAFGLGLLLATVMAMGGIYRGLVVEGLSIVQACGADLWVVQMDTNGPFAENSRVPDDLYRQLRAVPGVRDAAPLLLQQIQLRVGPSPLRVQLIGYRVADGEGTPSGGLGAPPAVVAGRPIIRGRYEMMLGREARVPLGSEIRVARLLFTVVGLTDGIVSNGGDPVAYVSLRDAQEIQFLKNSEAVRNDRERLAVRLPSNTESLRAVQRITESTHLANAILVRLQPWADVAAIQRHVQRGLHYGALTEAQQEDLLIQSVIERGRRQTLLFRIILLLVSLVIIALIIYTMTLEKTRDIATLKVVGAPNSTIVAFILYESLVLGLLGYGFGALLISQTYQLFPRRVVIVPFDQAVLFGVVLIICLLASLLAIGKALRMDPAAALGGAA